MTTLLFTFATEDFVTPGHDEAILRLCSILSRKGIVGGFHVTGDYVRYLRDNCKTDVIHALKAHEVGYHSNTHGAFPFIGKVCENSSWDDAVAELTSTEALGIEDVCDVFDRFPAYFVSEFIKAPQLLVAARRAGLETVGFSLIPGGGSPFAWLAGSLCYTGPFMGVESPPASTRLESFKAEFDQIYTSARNGEVPGVIKLFNHPYKFVYNNNIASWCGDNDLYNAYAVHKTWRLPVKSFYDTGTREDLFRQFEVFLDHTLSKNDICYASTGELSRLYATQPPKTLKLCDVVNAAKKAFEAWNYVSCADYTLSLAEVFALVTHCLKEYHQSGALPECVPWRRIIGPVEMMPDPQPGAFEVDADAFLDAMVVTNRDISFYKKMPSVVDVAQGAIPVAFVCKAALKALLCLAGGGGGLGAIAIEDTPLYPAIADDVYFSDREWTRSIYPQDFKGKAVCQYGRLQSWSYKPAKGPMA